MGENYSNRNERNIEDPRSALKQILHYPKSTPNIEILFETGIWPIIGRIEYSTMMLFHSVMNSDDERISKKIIEQQQTEKLNNAM